MSQAYSEIFHNEAVEEMNICVTQIAEIDVFFDGRYFGLKLLEAWE